MRLSSVLFFRQLPVIVMLTFSLCNVNIYLLLEDIQPQFTNILSFNHFTFSSMCRLMYATQHVHWSRSALSPLYILTVLSDVWRTPCGIDTAAAQLIPNMCCSWPAHIINQIAPRICDIPWDYRGRNNILSGGLTKTWDNWCTKYWYRSRWWNKTEYIDTELTPRWSQGECQHQHAKRLTVESLTCV